MSLYGLDFEEVQWELQVWGGVSFSFLFSFFPGGGITSGFTPVAKIPEPDDVRCRITLACLKTSQRLAVNSALSILPPGALFEK